MNAKLGLTRGASVRIGGIALEPLVILKPERKARD